MKPVSSLFILILLVAISVSYANRVPKAKTRKIYHYGDTRDKVVLKEEEVQLTGTIVTINPVNNDVTGYKVQLKRTRGTNPKIAFAKDLGKHLLIYSKCGIEGTAKVYHMGNKN